MNKKINQNIKAIILGLIIAVGAGYVSAWTGAPANPPNNNVAAPVNVGGTMASSTTLQTKTVDLTILGALTSMHLFTPELTVTTGSPREGQVLTASDSTGSAEWRDIGAAGGGSQSTVVTSGGNNSTGYWYQIGSLLIQGGILSPGTKTKPYVSFPKPYYQVATVQFTPSDSGSTGQKIHSEHNSELSGISNTGFYGHTGDQNDSFTWLAIGTANVSGCTNQYANNYDPQATVTDGSCTFDPIRIVTPLACSKTVSGTTGTYNISGSATGGSGALTYKVIGSYTSTAGATMTFNSLSYSTLPTVATVYNKNLQRNQVLKLYQGITDTGNSATCI